MAFKKVWISIAVAHLINRCAGHTWAEQLQIIQDGKFTGAAGYPRGYVPRGAATGDPMSWISPQGSRGAISDQDFLCPEIERQQQQTNGFPRLQAQPGNFIAIKYLENGHVTQPDIPPGKPKGSGTVFIFGTTQPKSDEKMLDVLQWTADGNGGDKRGRLIATNNYDDGRCYQINPTDASKNRQEKTPNPIEGQPGVNHELWCETDFQLPKDVKTGASYTLYWVWEWPTFANPDGTGNKLKDEYYSTCMDIDVVGDSVKVQAADFKPLGQQDPNTKAVPQWDSRTAFKTVPGPLAALAAPSPAPSNPGGVFIPGASSAAPPLAQPTAPASAPAPAPPAAPSAPADGSCARGFPCSTLGSLVCIGMTSFGICDINNCALPQPLAAGTYCSNGIIQAGSNPGPGSPSSSNILFSRTVSERPVATRTSSQGFPTSTIGPPASETEVVSTLVQTVFSTVTMSRSSSAVAVTLSTPSISLGVSSVSSIPSVSPVTSTPSARSLLTSTVTSSSISTTVTPIQTPAPSAGLPPSRHRASHVGKRALLGAKFRRQEMEGPRHY